MRGSTAAEGSRFTGAIPALGVTMKQIPFLAFPSSEQDAVVRAVRRAGIAPRVVCVSRFESAAAPAAHRGSTVTVVSTPGWCRTYCAEVEADWIGALEQELAVASAG